MTDERGPKPVTRETLDDLPVGTVVLDVLDMPVQKRAERGTWLDGEQIITTDELLTRGPLIILLTPEQHEAGKHEAWEAGYGAALENDANRDPGPDGDWIDNPYRADREEAGT